MCMGVATANSILVVSFAREQLPKARSGRRRAGGGRTRFRPVLMTALAMIIGMAPMAIEPGQNSPLGRAVIGGLLFATFATLLFVPTVFSIAHRRQHSQSQAPSRSPACPPTPDPEPPCLLNSPIPPQAAPRPAGARRLRDRRDRPRGLRRDGSRQEPAGGRGLDQRAGDPDRATCPARARAREQELILPGNVERFYAGSLFARASGYVTAWHKDIGAHVTKGETLATISAPDLDQQLEEAKAQLVQLQAAVEQAQANADLGQVTDQRTSQLVAQGWSSKEQGDTDRLTAASRAAALSVAKANVIAQQAAVSRLEELTRFEQIKAPFDGVVTARNVDIGDLVNAGGTTGRALFHFADIHRMRIYVNVPQAFLSELSPGIKATLHLPGQKETFEAQLVSTSNAVTETSRTSLCRAPGRQFRRQAVARRFRGGSFPHSRRSELADRFAHCAHLRPQRHASRRTRPRRQGRLEARCRLAAISENEGADRVRPLAIRPARRQPAPKSIQTGDVVRIAGADGKTPAVAAAGKAEPAPAKSD